MMKIITSESEYICGLFPTIPTRIFGQDALLIGVDGIPRLVDDYLTTRDIRKGKYNKLVRVSTTPFPLDIFLKATSKNAPYQFDVNVSVDCRITNSVSYYMSRTSLDVEKSLNITLSRMIVPETKKYELIDDCVSENILRKLQETRQYLLESLGIAFEVISVEVKPDKNAENDIIKRMTDQKLNVLIEEKKNAEIAKLKSRNMEDAILGQVAEGKIDMKTALEQLSQSNRSDNYSRLDDIERIVAFLRKLQTENFISDEEAGQRINEFLQRLPLSFSSISVPNMSQLEEKNTNSDSTLDELLPDEEEDDQTGAM